MHGLYSLLSPNWQRAALTALPFFYSFSSSFSILFPRTPPLECLPVRETVAAVFLSSQPDSVPLYNAAATRRVAGAKIGRLSLPGALSHCVSLRTPPNALALNAARASPKVIIVGVITRGSNFDAHAVHHSPSCHRCWERICIFRSQTAEHGSLLFKHLRRSSGAILLYQTLNL